MIQGQTFINYPTSAPLDEDTDIIYPEFPETVSLPITEESVKCECGEDSVGGSQHSSWCKKFEKNT